MTKRKIVTFSGRMRSGKDMLCKAMEKAYGVKTFALATHLKTLCCKIMDVELPFLSPWDIPTLNNWKDNRGVLCEDGIPLSETSVQLISEYTEFPLETVEEKCEGFSFRNVRELLQRLGTDVIREIEPDWHITRTLVDISRLPEGMIACIDDIRFPNELEAFKRAGAYTFFIMRNNAETVSNHDSENELTHSDFPDNRVILNNGTIEALCSEFVTEFGNGFNIVDKKPIFLSDYPEYRDVDRGFGKEETPLVSEILRQNADREAFLKDGLITFRNNTRFNVKEVLEGMGIEKTYSYERSGGRFVIDNPVAYENLKRWL